MKAVTISDTRRAPGILLDVLIQSSIGSRVVGAQALIMRTVSLQSFLKLQSTDFMVQNSKFRIAAHVQTCPKRPGSGSVLSYGICFDVKNVLRGQL